MGSSTDAKKTPRRKPKKPASTTASKSDCLLSNPGTTTIATTTTTTTTTASLQSVRKTNGFSEPSVSSESMSTLVHFTDSASIASCSQPQEQEVQSMQKTSTSGMETDRKSPSHLPSAKFYLSGDGCFFCCRSKVGNAEVNLHHLVESKSGGELSSLPQLWICLECQQSFNQKEIDSVTTDLNEELMLDSSLLATNEVSKLSPLSSNTCNCFSCTETRHIKEQNESFEQELQQYLYEDLHQLVAFIYQASLSTLTADVHEEYQLSINNTMKLHNVMQKIYCRNPQRLFRCLESWAAALIMERRSALCERLPATFQQLTVCTASQLITSLLDEYSCFCFVGQNLMSLFDSQGNSTLKEFRLTLELHQQYLFHQLIFAQLQKFLTSAVAMISMHMTRLRTENAATANPHSLLLQKYAKFQDKMNQILIRWMKYCQPSETSKDENWWQDNQRSSKSRICEMKTRPNIQTEGTESYLTEGIWHLPRPNECNVSSHYPSYSDLGSPAAPLEIASPSSSQRSESSGSECSSQDDKCDTCQILESFIQNSRELVNSANAIRAKEEMNNEDKDQNVEEHEIVDTSSHLIVNLCDHCSEDHLNADDDDSGEDADDDCDEIEDAGKGHEVTVVQPTLEQQCQCFSCINISSTVSADISQQSLIPSFSSLSIYPPAYGSTMPVLQQGQIVNHDLHLLSHSRVQQALQIQGQQGSKEQLASKSSNPESCANVMSNKMLLPEWDLQNSLFFKHENNYGKIMLASNDGPLLTTMSVVSSASETQAIVDSGNVWFKVDQPSTVANSAIILPQNSVTALSPGLFKINADYMHLSQSLSSGTSVFPLSVPGTYAGIIGEVDQHPQCSLHQPVAVTTSASNVFSIASSFYQNTSSSTTFVQTPAFGQSSGASETSSSTLYGLSSGVKLPEESVENVYVNNSLLYETGTNSTVADSTHANASLANFRLCAIDVSSNYDAVDTGDEIPLCTSSGFADIAPHMCSMLPETMEQFNIRQATTVAGSEIVVCAASVDNHVPLTYRHSLPLHCPGSDSQPSGCSEDQQSLTSCKADSQQDDNDCVSQDESGSSGGSNLKDGKFCDCWHCEVFGRSTPATLPTSRNFPEVRDRLRLRLKKKKSTQNAVELEKTEDMITAAPVQQNLSDMKDIEEVMKFINGGGGDGAEIPLKDELIKSKNKAAKRSRQKLRKQQQKVKEPVKSEVSVGSQTNHCDSNKQKNALLSHCVSSSHPTDCCKNSKSNFYDSSDSSKKTSNKVENMTLRNMLNTMKLSGKHIVNIDKTAAGLEEKSAHCNGSENGRVKELEKNFTSHSSSMSTLQKNHILAPDLVKNGMLRHSASHSCVLGKSESLHGNIIAGTEESSVLSNQNAKSEPEEDFRFEGGMKPVTISSEDGVRTILASPLLQAELAKNKPLQKLFMQAVQQQQQSREKQEAKAMAETEVKSCQHPVNQFSSTVASLQSKTREAAKQQLCPVAHKSSCVSVAAESAGMLEQKATRSDESKILHHFQRNGTAVNKKCIVKLQQNGCQSVGTTSHQANQARSSIVPREKTLFGRAQPYTISDEKLHDNSTRSSITTAPRKTTQNGKTCKLSTDASSVSGFGAQSVSNMAQCGCQEHCRTDCLPSSGCLVPNKLHPQISNGFSSSVASPVVITAPSLLQSEATASKVLSKQRGKKPTNSRASKKAVLPSTRNEQSGLCIENGREIVKKVDFIGTDKDCSQELEVLMKTDSEKQNFLLTLPASADATECFGNEDAEPCLSTKTKKSKKKSKSRGSVASVDEIFLPKNVQDDSHLDEHEREIEEFKRFCSNSAPSGNRQKVNLNNVKDMFNKKKTVSAGYQ